MNRPSPQREGYTEKESRGLFIWYVEERQVRFAFCFAQEQQRQFAGVIVAPHGRLSAGAVAAGRDVVPAARAVVDGVKDQTLVLWLASKGKARQRAYSRW